MPEDTLDVEHITDLAEKAEVIAEATNRRAEDVLADLLDDGQANMSAGIDAQRPDFLDKAQEQAEKLKSLLTTLIPIILMLGGVAAEGLGVLDLTSWGEESMWDEDPNNPNIYWGCMNQDATNYDEDANEDDDSCEYPPPRCDITLENITLSKNHNASWVHYDLNCDGESTYGGEPEGFNVSIQFWNTDVNETETLQYLVTSHYIAGDEVDTQELCLDDLETGTYDFHWIAIWEDEEGVLFNLLEHWESIEISGE